MAKTIGRSDCGMNRGTSLMPHERVNRSGKQPELHYNANADQYQQCREERCSLCLAVAHHDLHSYGKNLIALLFQLDPWQRPRGRTRIRPALHPRRNIRDGTGRTRAFSFSL